MTRDWNLIRKILLRMEEQPESRYELRASDWPDYDEDVINYHLNMLIDARLIEGACQAHRSRVTRCVVRSITWKGHELLDTIRKEGIWARIKEAAIDKGVDLTFDLIPMLFHAIVRA